MSCALDKLTKSVLPYPASRLPRSLAPSLSLNCSFLCGYHLPGNRHLTSPTVDMFFATIAPGQRARWTLCMPAPAAGTASPRPIGGRNRDRWSCRTWPACHDYRQRATIFEVDNVSPQPRPAQASTLSLEAVRKPIQAWYATSSVRPRLRTLHPLDVHFQGARGYDCARVYRAPPQRIAQKRGPSGHVKIECNAQNVPVSAERGHQTEAIPSPASRVFVTFSFENPMAVVLRPSDGR